MYNYVTMFNNLSKRKKKKKIVWWSLKPSMYVYDRERAREEHRENHLCISLQGFLVF